MQDSTTNEEQPVTPYAHAAKFGVILGAIAIVLTILFYAIDLSFMASFKFIGLILVIYLGFVIYAGLNYRSEVGGYLPYGKAFVHGFLLLAISALVSTVFNIVLYSVIDPELAQKMTDVIIENTESMMRNFGAPDSSIDEATAKMRVEMPENFSTVGLMWGYVKNLIGCVVISAIASIFVKKTPPVEM